MALFGTVILSAVVPPIQAVGILLPVLLVMDAVSLWIWRGQWDWPLMWTMLPGAAVGIGLGWATAAFVTDDAVRLLVGAIAIIFVLRWAFASKESRSTAAAPNQRKASFFGALAGYTSFIAHAGGPPYQVYTVPLRMAPTVFTATSVMFFTIMNAAKVVPYFFLGQFSTENLVTSAIMVPIAIVSTYLGAMIVKRLKPEIFYPLMYLFIVIVGIRLIWDGLT